MYEIAIANKQKQITVNRRQIRRAVTTALKLEQVAQAEISIAIVDDATIHQINRDYLQHDYPTDVISFLLEVEGGSTERLKAGRGAGKTILGDIVLSADTAARMAESVGWSVDAEIVLYVVHGLLHLCGYDDLTKRELPIMRRRERDVLEALGLDLPLRDDDPLK